MESVGATTVEHLKANLAAVDLSLPADALRTLDALSAPQPTELDHFFVDATQQRITGGTAVTRTFP